MFKQLAAAPETVTERLATHAQSFARDSRTLLASVQLQPLALSASSGNATAPADMAHLCFFSRPWRLSMKPDTAAKIEQELAALISKGYLSSYRLVHDRPLPQADDVVTLEMVLPVPGPGAPAPAAAAPATVSTKTQTVLELDAHMAAMQLAVPFWERNKQ
jgi:hypothetical protein